MNLFFLLLVAHAIADFPLQGDFLSKAKAPGSFLGNGEVIWPWCMGAHCMIQGGFVAVLTGSLWLGLAEFATHFVIDVLKCRKTLTFAQDQVAHIGCKAIWAALA